MNVGDTLKLIVEERKDDYLEAKGLCKGADEIERYETLFIAAVNAYGIWLSD